MGHIDIIKLSSNTVVCTVVLGLKRVVVVILFGLVWLASLTALRSVSVLVSSCRLLRAGTSALDINVHLIFLIFIIILIAQSLSVLLVPIGLLLLLLLLQNLLLALLRLKLGFLVQDTLNSLHFSHLVNALKKICGHHLSFVTQHPFFLLPAV